MEDIDVCIKFDHNHKEEIKTYFSSLGSKVYVHILHLDLVQVDNVLISLKNKQSWFKHLQKNSGKELFL